MMPRPRLPHFIIAISGTLVLGGGIVLWQDKVVAAEVEARPRADTGRQFGAVVKPTRRPSTDLPGGWTVGTGERRPEESPPGTIEAAVEETPSSFHVPAAGFTDEEAMFRVRRGWAAHDAVRRAAIPESRP